MAKAILFKMCRRIFQKTIQAQFVLLEFSYFHSRTPEIVVHNEMLRLPW